MKQEEAIKRYIHVKGEHNFQRSKKVELKQTISSSFIKGLALYSSLEIIAKQNWTLSHLIENLKKSP